MKPESVAKKDRCKLSIKVRSGGLWLDYLQNMRFLSKRVRRFGERWELKSVREVGLGRRARLFGHVHFINVLLLILPFTELILQMFVIIQDSTILDQNYRMVLRSETSQLIEILTRI